MVRDVTKEELQAALAEGRVFALYDNRGEGSYAARHIKGARWLSVPDAAAGKGLPADKGALLVFY
ncbi:MAG: hypothetical protein HS108_03610 [Planctomycetes bacterium]|jgi:hypothetical protein|nr:hypothetical protein [Planctomycetota bacterium]MCL4731707.1 hypothetical protein [Planctomycetota bacterium]